MRTGIINLVVVLMMCLLIGSAGLNTGCSPDTKEGFKPERPAQLSRSPRPDIALAKVFAGQDVQITGNRLTDLRGATGRDVLVIEKNFTITAGADTFKGYKAVVWLKRPEAMGDRNVSVWCYIPGRVSAEKGKGARLQGLNWQIIENGQAMVVWLTVSGDAFVTAKSTDPALAPGGDFYKKAFSAVSAADSKFAGSFESVAPDKIEQAAKSPLLATPFTPKPGQPVKPKTQQVQPTREKTSPVSPVKGGAFGFIERILGTKKTETGPKAGQETLVRYPVNLAPAGDVEPNIEMGFAKGRQVATVLGRFYLWQKTDERGGLLEMLADAAVVFYSMDKKNTDQRVNGVHDLESTGVIEAIYLRGDVIITEGLRTIRADELYYDFVNKKGLAVNATLRSFDISRGIPIYVRAAEIRQLARNKFAAQNVVLTTSEFAMPQVSLEVSDILITDNASVDEQIGQTKDSDYDAQMHDVRLKAEDTTIFYWPYLRSNLERPDVPLKTMRVGNDSIWGTTVETKWYLARLLGLQEPDGTSETFDVDYFSKRGLGTGMDVDYKQENRFGKIIGYLIDDRGEDRLGRVSFRRNLDPPEELRGRFGWVHREFMPYNWQLTTGINYESDENFVESYYRREFNTGPDRETYIHLKRIEDNWGLAFLGKGRLNNFEDELEESPTGEYHLAGQSLLDDKLTLYSDTQGGRFRQRIGENHNTLMDEDYFTNGTHRTEIDLPLWASGFKAVPFIAGTVGYDDRSGFDRSLVDGSNSGPFNEKAVAIGEAGIRASSDFWNVYPDIHSRLFDLDGLRHTVRPEVIASIYEESDPVVKQHDVIHLGISQRLQTKRGGDDTSSSQRSTEPKTVDWMRLDLGGTWFTDNDPRTDDSGPYRFIWNQPQTPLRMYTMPGILNGDLGQGLKKFETYGPYRDYLDADYVWQVSDTTALLSDVYYDIHEGSVEQYDIGFSRIVWPDLSSYIGSRYLKNVKVLNEHGSNAFIFAASYVLDERYTLVFAQQYDFEYRANVESDITLIRRYGRVFWSLTISSDASLDSQGIMFNIWPEGIPELALGGRKYTGLSSPGGY